MDIVLNQKDADWVAGQIREHISDLQKTYEESILKSKKSNEFCEGLVAKLENEFGTNDDITKAKDELIKVRDQNILGITEIYNKKMNTYCKMLELMICGSES